MSQRFYKLNREARHLYRKQLEDNVIPYVNRFCRNSAKGKMHMDWAWLEKLPVDRRILLGFERVWAPEFDE